MLLTQRTPHLSLHDIDVYKYCRTTVLIYLKLWQMICNQFEVQIHTNYLFSRTRIKLNIRDRLQQICKIGPVYLGLLSFGWVSTLYFKFAMITTKKTQINPWELVTFWWNNITPPSAINPLYFAHFVRRSHPRPRPPRRNPTTRL